MMKRATTISLDSKLLEAARKEAKAQRRTFSAQLESWIEEKLGNSAPPPTTPRRRERPAA